MPITVPNADDVQALHSFIQARNEEEWEAIRSDPASSDEAVERFRRVSNSNKLALAGSTAYLLHLLKDQQLAQAERVWETLTTCGEQWQDHPDWNAAWTNPARARLLQGLADRSRS